jgi:tetratricopeptide (TPR) repeat protein
MLDRDRYWDCLDQAIEASSGGRVDEALSWLEEALRANPKGAEAHNGRGEIFWDHGRYEEAFQEFQNAVEADPDCHAARLNLIEMTIEEFRDCEEALESADRLLRRSLEPSLEAEVYYLKAKALFYSDDLDGALFLLRRAIQVHSETVHRAFEGQILFEMGLFEQAEQMLARVLGLDPDNAHALYYRAQVLEHLGRAVDAERLYVQAAEIAPDQYPLPIRIEPVELEGVAEEALRRLPAPVRRYVRNCPILIEDLPERELVVRENVSPSVMGLFLGTPATEPGASPSWGTEPKVAPDRIVLFKRNLEKAAESRADLIEQIQITVKHEIGHFLGLDEDELERLGIG